MSTHAQLTPEIRAVLDRFHLAQLVEYAQRSGREILPLTHDEIPYIDETEALHAPLVPMMDGSIVRAPFTGGREAANAPLPAARAGGAAGGSKLKYILGALAILAAFIFMYFSSCRGQATSAPPAARGADGSDVIATLPAGMDAIVSSGEVKTALVVPRTLEITVGDGLTTTTFVIVAVEVKRNHNRGFHRATR